MSALPTRKASYTNSSFQSFYTDAQQIRELMLHLLGNVEGLKILEPSAGRGALIEGLRGTPSLVDAVDIDERHISLLQQLPNHVNPIHADFVDQFVSGGEVRDRLFHSGYDAVVCNPPYGLQFSLDYRKRIKKRLPDAYARESYGLFMHLAIRALREGGRYVFIVPDTFLTSRNHRPLREFILNEGRPSHVVRFASQLFETVNFGYGHLCVIAGNRGPLRPDDELTWIEPVNDGTTLMAQLEECELVSGGLMIQRCAEGWVHPTRLAAVDFSRATVALGELAECRTGIYTGDNTKYCGFDSQQPPSRSSNGHPIDWHSKVRTLPLDPSEVQSGVDGPLNYVPFVRGGHKLPLEHTRWALDWSKAAVDSYRTEKKARLQNHAFYFREGLAIPMVTSGRISASYMKGAVFDQGAVGVFPHDTSLIAYLLIYLNSEQISARAKQLINPGANNSANYVKRIPIVAPTPDEVTRAQGILEKARSLGWDQTAGERSELMSTLLS